MIEAIQSMRIRGAPALGVAGAFVYTYRQPKIYEATTQILIETNPPQTNKDVQAGGRTFTRQIDQMPPKAVLDEIDAKVDMAKLETVLMEEGLAKFADPQKALLALLAQKRAALVGSGKK